MSSKVEKAKQEKAKKDLEKMIAEIKQNGTYFGIPKFYDLDALKSAGLDDDDIQVYQALRTCEGYITNENANDSLFMANLDAIQQMFEVYQLDFFEAPTNTESKSHSEVADGFGEWETIDDGMIPIVSSKEFEGERIEGIYLSEYSHEKLTVSKTDMTPQQFYKLKSLNDVNGIGKNVIRKGMLFLFKAYPSLKLQLTKIELKPEEVAIAFTIGEQVPHPKDKNLTIRRILDVRVAHKS